MPQLRQLRVYRSLRCLDKEVAFGQRERIRGSPRAVSVLHGMKSETALSDLTCLW